jgi:hypothetical protein
MCRFARALCAAVALVALPSCVHHHHHDGHHFPARVGVTEPGPPPHAPAHGHRHKRHHHGLDLVFDSHLGVYAVVGWNDHYFHEDHFYRLVDGIWQVSVRIDGGWAATKPSRLPPGLARKGGKTKRRGGWRPGPPARPGH